MTEAMAVVAAALTQLVLASLHAGVVRLASMSFLEHLNAAGAVVGVLIAAGAINRMTKDTECTIIFSFVTTLVGLAGYAITSFRPTSWERAFDTLLIFGIAAVLVGTRKRTTWVKPELMPRISVGLSFAAWISFFALVG